MNTYQDAVINKRSEQALVNHGNKEKLFELDVYFVRISICFYTFPNKSRSI